MQPILFLLFFIFVIPLAYADVTLTATLLEEGEAGGNADDEIILDNDSTFDVSETVQTVTETTETIGGVEVDLTQEVEFVANDGDVVTLKNTELPTVTVEIPDNTIVKAPTSWNGEITPPKQISTSGSVPTNFQTPSTSILVGSPDVILVFDDAVTILLTGTTGQTAYKTPGSNNWILISGCTGTYAAPNDPPDNGECSISNGSDTKILTFHFTEFSGLSAAPSSTPAASTPAASTSSGSSGGHGRTGVGPSSGGGSYSIKQSNNQIPDWFSDVVLWQKQGLISSLEMLNAWKWLMAQ